MTRTDLLGVFQELLGQDVLSYEVTDDDIWIRVEPAAWARAAEVALAVGCKYFSFLSAIDWQPNPYLDGEKVFSEGFERSEAPEVITSPEVRKTGGESRFQVIARVANIIDHVGVTLVTDVPTELAVPTWTGVFRGADWHERETWEMFGIVFDGHPGLRHIYLPAEFEGFPLRKDFPLLARELRPWPGLVDLEEMPPAEEEAKPADAQPTEGSKPDESKPEADGGATAASTGAGE